ncbi:MAG: hypothetical protein KF830_17375 [Planctomycetes bacterium]|nr:hypothetical protein [Planctomycetota bacterium]
MQCAGPARGIPVFLAAGAALAFGIAADAWPYMADDAFISLRYADRLLQGEGLTWTDGERVEGYSNLLWVLLVAGLGAPLGDLVLAARALGIGCTLATLALLAGGRTVPTGLPAALVVVALGALHSTSLWAIGGLEGPLAMLLVAAAMSALAAALAGSTTAAARRWLVGCGVALGLLAWTRPDAPLFAAVAGAVAVWHLPPGARCRGLALLLAPVALAVLVQTGFRLAYYGEWLPNTAQAKASASRASVLAGWHYLWSAGLSLRALLVPAALGVAFAAGRRPRSPALHFALLATLVWGAYLVPIGGDHFPRNRMLLPLFAPLVVLAAHGLAELHRGGRLRRGLAWLLALGAVVLARWDVVDRHGDPRQEVPTWEWLGEPAGTWLRQAFARERPLVAVDAAGGVPFFSRLPCLDMLGLCDRTIARSRPDQLPGFWAGHNRGDGPYVLDRAPDLILFGYPTGLPQPTWTSGRQMELDPRFVRDYRLVVMETGAMPVRGAGPTELRISAWLHTRGVLGPRRRTGAVQVPAFWLGCYRQPYAFRAYDPPGDASPAADAWRRDFRAAYDWWHSPPVVGRLDRDAGVVVAELRRAGRHATPAFHLPPGTHRIVAPALPAGVQLVLCAADGGELPRSGDGWRVVADGGREVQLVCAVDAAATLPFSLPALSVEHGR